MNEKYNQLNQRKEFAIQKKCAMILWLFDTVNLVKIFRTGLFVKFALSWGEKRFSAAAFFWAAFFGLCKHFLFVTITPAVVNERCCAMRIQLRRKEIDQWSPLVTFRHEISGLQLELK